MRTARQMSPATGTARPRILAAAACALAVALLPGCSRRGGPPEKDTTPPIVSNAKWGPIDIEIRVEPGRVELNRDMVLTVTESAPATMEVQIPPLADRLQGFSLAGSIDRDPVLENGRRSRVHRLLLTPIVADRYRIAPFAVRYIDTSVQPPLTGWFPTPSVIVPSKPPPPGKDAIDGDIALRRVRPSARTITLTIGGVVLALATLAGLLYLLSRVRREIQLRRLSPSERALRELEQLLRKDLLTRGLVKDFYVELTMVVRRYIERQHGVRAPEQTTEEFLLAISRDPRFGASVSERLKRFLVAADMVKFAAHHPSAADTNAAVTTARDYITHEAGTGTRPATGNRGG